MVRYATAFLATIALHAVLLAEALAGSVNCTAPGSTIYYEGIADATLATTGGFAVINLWRGERNPLADIPPPPGASPSSRDPLVDAPPLPGVAPSRPPDYVVIAAPSMSCAVDGVSVIILDKQKP